MSKDIIYKGKIEYDNDHDRIKLNVEEPIDGHFLLPANRYERKMLEDILEKTGKEKLEDLDTKEFTLKLTIQD